jgi:guanine deaminase
MVSPRKASSGGEGGRGSAKGDRPLPAEVNPLAALAHPPFTVRARVLTPLDSGQTRFLADGMLVVDADGRIAAVDEWDPGAATAHGPAEAVVDLRPWLLLPGLVDLHAHLPQLPNAGLGYGLDLLSWLKRYIFPLERAFDGPTAERLAPQAFQAFAGAGTTTVVLYGAVYKASLEAIFQAAERHGIRAVIGKVMMDRIRYDEVLPDAAVLETSLRESADLCAAWHMRDGGRLRYAFTPRFAVSCSEEMLRRSAELAVASGAYWQTHLSEDPAEIAAVTELFPEAIDYTDVYDRAGGLGPRSIMAHAIHLSERELERLVETGTRVAHCPESNLFLGAGLMPLARYLDAGLSVGLGSDVAGGPDVSVFRQMRVAGQGQAMRRAMAGDEGSVLDPMGLLRLGTLEGARALGIDDVTGSIEVGKEADLIAIDPAATAPVPGADVEDPSEIVGRLIFRTHPDMVRGTWVRGRRLEGAGVSPGAGGGAT